MAVSGFRKALSGAVCPATTRLISTSFFREQNAASRPTLWLTSRGISNSTALPNAYLMGYNEHAFLGSVLSSGLLVGFHAWIPQRRGCRWVQMSSRSPTNAAPRRKQGLADALERHAARRQNARESRPTNPSESVPSSSGLFVHLPPGRACRLVRWWVQMGCSSVPAWPSHPPGTALGHGTPNAIRRLEFL